MAGYLITMGIYSKYVLPQVIHFACSEKPVMRQREKVVPLATGEGVPGARTS